ncbi:MAG: PDZ domain-containing protein [Verrucomicrobia bacterium]|nr:MAG: PDZ domain-containing protein [Verrucomicrobiota bacterium]
MSPLRPATCLRLAAIAMLAWPMRTAAIELPPAMMLGLQAENFAEREQAQAELLAWTRQRADASPEALYQQSRSAAEPEQRQRCLGVLRELVCDEYLRNGVGYVGFRMNPNTEAVKVPGEDLPRFAVRVLQVEPDTPGHKAGLLGGDLLLGVDDIVWHQEDTSTVVSEKIKSFKAGTKVTLKLFREGKLVDLPLALGRRPAAADLLQFQFGFGGMPIGPEAIAGAERTAKDEYFHRWLAARKAKD